MSGSQPSDTTAQTDVKPPYRTPKDGEPTPDLNAFDAAYQEDDNEWWVIACGHHQNLYDAAMERAATLTKLLDTVLAQFDEKGHPGEPCIRSGWVRESRFRDWQMWLAANRIDEKYAYQSGEASA